MSLPRQNKRIKRQTNMKQTKSQIIKELVKQTGLPKKQVEAVLNEYLLTIREVVSNGESFNWRNFGTFSLKERKPRKVRDFSTGESRIAILGPIAVFRPSKNLLEAVARNTKPTETNVSFKDTDNSLVKKKGTPSKVSLSTRTEKDLYVGKRSRVSKKSPISRVSPKHPLTIKGKDVDILTDNQIEEEDSCNIIQSSANPEQTQDSHIKFVPRFEFESKDRYPIVWLPKIDSFLKLPRQGRSDNRGYKEADFINHLKSSDLNVGIDDNCHLMVPGRRSPYEPDIVLFDKSLGLFVDVEIDEPYDGYLRIETHNIESSDDIRNGFFCESGWVVVRFTEHQVHINPDGCVKFIKSVLCGLKEGVVNSNSFLKEEDRWDKKQAVEWSRNSYRENYLGIQGFSKKTRHQKVICSGEDTFEMNIERTPIHITKPTNEQITESLSGRRNIVFDEDTHTYYPADNQTGNADALSVTTLIDKFFPYFDKEAYIKKKMEETGMTRETVENELNQPALIGTEMHKQFELFLKGLPHNEEFKEFQLFKDFCENEIERRNLKFYDAEKIIYLPDYNVAGTVDALFQKDNGDFVMVDWKRSTHLIIDGYAKKYGFGRALSIISHLDDSSYYKYELQQSFYKYILEKEYGMKISSMILAVIHPQYDRYYAIKLSNYREKEVTDMLEAIDMINN